ncbi:sugar nucleotide-binding protein [Metabacillus litoralis]|uniref:sugar nucleotide-binding protein n=1 Tax=Metabacillus litoralis TaxID=152268 RepID=UPI0020404FB4|nr:sugar nucleotide-binding protein [Metabacillus litoralis]MCM3409854.1 sugar nucleotide-binding protein [Metabacillus litoralis]
MKILILGGKGFFGTSIMAQALLKNITVYGTSRTISNSINIIKTDVSNKTSLLSLLDKSVPEVIIWALMSDKNEIELVNNGLLNLLSLIKKETKLIFMSTDAIFTGGTGNYVETDKTGLLPSEAPLANYVNGKNIGENLIKNTHKNHMIIRTGPIYGNSLNIEKRTVRIIQKIKRKESVKAPTNLYRCFVHVEDLSKAILELIAIDFLGTIHLGPSKKVSYHTFYKQRLKQLGIKASISACKIDSKENPYISLDTSLNTQKANLILKTSFREI